ncbi:MAG: FkbM family methyltransferase [Ruminococcaceae bacterium]|nr:FkbM family methyltransferase [Oscillospiraceae bacterium]
MTEKYLRLLTESKNILLYGAGSLGKIMLPYVKEQFNISGFAVTNEKNITEKEILGFTVDSIKNWVQKLGVENVTVLITISEHHHKEIIDVLTALGVENIIPLTKELRDRLVEIYSIQVFESHGVKLDGEIMTLENMNVVNPLKYDYKFARNLFIQIADFIFPSLYNDFSMITEGPYEYKNVKVNAGETVFDCGANMGAFSAYAASKNCIVYAFEPTPELHPILTKHSELNKNKINIVPFAVSNVTGECDLRICDYTVGGNSLVMENGFTDTLKIKTVTIDEFVKENNLKVDFIKADIEGAERLMLEGAKNTLKEQAPKLSVCTYHYKDDPEVLKDIILSANPNYKIEFKYQKLYAHI